MNLGPIRLACFGLLLCLWWPLGFGAGSLKLLGAGLLLTVLPLNSGNAKFWLPLLAALLLLPLAPNFHDRFYFVECWLLAGIAIGGSLPRKTLEGPLLLYVWLNLIFVILFHLEWLPFEWNQNLGGVGAKPFLKSSLCPGLTDSPISLSFSLILGFGFLTPGSSRLWAYALPALLLAAQSGSKIGLGLCVLATFNHLFPRVTHRQWLISTAILALIAWVSLDEHYTQRPLQTRFMLWEAAKTVPVTLTGYGPAWFQMHSGNIMPPKTECNSFSRVQFHPHNDLLHYFLSFGLLGLFLRLWMYSLVVYRVSRNQPRFALILGLISSQFNPDFLTLPGSLLFGALLASSLATKASPTPSRSPWIGPILGLLFLLFSGLYIHSQWSQARLLAGHIQSPPLFFQSPQHQVNLGVVHARNQNFTQALGLFNRLESKAPDFGHIHYLRAGCLAATGNMEAAEEALRKSLAINPCHVQSMRALADILMKTNREDQARRWMRTMRQRIKGH